MTKRNILVIGGAGYIGAHMVCALQEAGYRPIVFDNLSTGHAEMIQENALFAKGDLERAEDLEAVLTKHPIGAVIHMAARSLVGESVENPLLYYQNNVGAAVNLLKHMVQFKVPHLIFSSTAAVYGNPSETPLTETAETRPINPYGRTKLMIEQMMADTAAAHGLSYVSLRYFNAAGAHEKKNIGEQHNPETHLIPNLLASFAGGDEMTVHGSDYETEDGTCVRDYIHVQDLCDAHLKAIEYLEDRGPSDVFNLGSEHGYSVGEVIRSAEAVTGKTARVRLGPRRMGDPPVLIASAQKARKVLHWKPTRGLEAILKTAWRWHGVQHVHA